MTTWPEEYDPYVGCGFRKVQGQWVVADGIHITADAPQEVKDYFRRKLEFYAQNSVHHPDIIIHDDDENE